MSFVDDFSLDNYETLEELREAKSAVENEISTLYGYIRGIKEKIHMLEEAETEEAP